MTEKSYIIAEAGVNHNGDMGLAKKLIDAACEAAADAVKFQSWRACDLVTDDAPKASYQINNDKRGGKTQMEMLRDLELKHEQHFELKEYCDKNEIDFMSSSFGIKDSEFLVKDLGLKIVKIGSGELTNGPMLLATARLGAKIILSTGMSNMDEITEALGILAYGYGGDDEKPNSDKFETAYFLHMDKLYNNVTLLHCTSEYPCLPEYINLGAIYALKARFSLNIGFSDHSLSLNLPAAAVAKGAIIIEKHMTLDKNAEGPDHKASLDAGEFKEMVKIIREVEIATGDGKKIMQKPEFEISKLARKFIVAACPIKKGDEFTEENLAIMRNKESSGNRPNDFWDLLGKQATSDYKKHQAINHKIAD